MVIKETPPAVNPDGADNFPAIKIMDIPIPDLMNIGSEPRDEQLQKPSGDILQSAMDEILKARKIQIADYMKKHKKRDMNTAIHAGGGNYDAKAFLLIRKIAEARGIPLRHSRNNFSSEDTQALALEFMSRTHVDPEEIYSRIKYRPQEAYSLRDLTRIIGRDLGNNEIRKIARQYSIDQIDQRMLSQKDILVISAGLSTNSFDFSGFESKPEQPDNAQSKSKLNTEALRNPEKVKKMRQAEEFFKVAIDAQGGNLFGWTLYRARRDGNYAEKLVDVGARRMAVVERLRTESLPRLQEVRIEVAKSQGLAESIEVLEEMGYIKPEEGAFARHELGIEQPKPIRETTNRKVEPAGLPVLIPESNDNRAKETVLKPGIAIDLLAPLMKQDMEARIKYDKSQAGLKGIRKDSEVVYALAPAKEPLTAEAFVLNTLIRIERQTFSAYHIFLATNQKGDQDLSFRRDILREAVRLGFGSRNEFTLGQAVAIALKIGVKGFSQEPVEPEAPSPVFQANGNVPKGATETEAMEEQADPALPETDRKAYFQKWAEDHPRDFYFITDLLEATGRSLNSKGVEFNLKVFDAFEALGIVKTGRRLNLTQEEFINVCSYIGMKGERKRPADVAVTSKPDQPENETLLRAKAEEYIRWKRGVKGRALNISDLMRALDIPITRGDISAQIRSQALLLGAENSRKMDIPEDIFMKLFLDYKRNGTFNISVRKNQTTGEGEVKSEDVEEANGFELITTEYASARERIEAETDGFYGLKDVVALVSEANPKINKDIIMAVGSRLNIEDGSLSKTDCLRVTDEIIKMFSPQAQSELNRASYSPRPTASPPPHQEKHSRFHISTREAYEIQLLLEDRETLGARMAARIGSSKPIADSGLTLEEKTRVKDDFERRISVVLNRIAYFIVHKKDFYDNNPHARNILDRFGQVDLETFYKYVYQVKKAHHLR